MNSLIPYSRHLLDEDDMAVVNAVLNSDFITQGPKIKEFEERLSAYCCAKYAVVFNSGTSALHGAYFSAGLSSGEEVITSPLTFVATANAALMLGANPVFVDVEYDTGNIDATLVESAINSRTKIIVPVHFAGHPSDMEKINYLAGKYNLKVVEDACHAIGALYKGEITGNCKYSDMTVFSFHPAKHITTAEGGAVITNNPDIYNKLLMFRTHGITKENFMGEPDGEWYYEMQFLGYNYRLTDIQAALGISQLKKIDSFIKRRREIASRYNRIFENNPFFDLPVERDYVNVSYHLYPIRLKDKYKVKKKDIFSRLLKMDLGVQVHYIPVYLQPYYRKLGYKKRQCPQAEEFYAREISIPIYPAMSDMDIEQVAEKIETVFHEFDK